MTVALDASRRYSFQTEFRSARIASHCVNSIKVARAAVAVAVTCGTTAPYPATMEPPIYFSHWLRNRSPEAEATHLELEQELSNRIEPSLTHHDLNASPYLLTTNDQASKHEYQLQTLQTKGFVLEESMGTGQSPFPTKPEEVTRPS